MKHRRLKNIILARRARALRKKLGRRSLVFVGLMGCGKSTIARYCSRVLHLPLRDSDQEIEKQANMPIDEIFATYGEQDFRRREKNVLKDLLQGRAGIIATGGGAFMNEEIRQLILENHIAIWLKTDENILLERLALRQDRPLLQTGNPEDIVRKLTKQRYPFYKQAPIWLTNNEVKYHVLCRKLMACLEHYMVKEKIAQQRIKRLNKDMPAKKSVKE